MFDQPESRGPWSPFYGVGIIRIEILKTQSILFMLLYFKKEIYILFLNSIFGGDYKAKQVHYKTYITIFFTSYKQNIYVAYVLLYCGNQPKTFKIDNNEIEYPKMF